MAAVSLPAWKHVKSGRSRHAIGPQSHGRYHTVDTGKLTTAPLFGKRLADTILAAG